MGKTWSRGTNSRLPFDVNVNLNLSIIVNLNFGDASIFSTFFFVRCYTCSSFIRSHVLHRSPLFTSRLSLKYHV